MAGKQFLGKVSSRLCSYPVGQKFCRNRSILFHFRNKHFLRLTQKFKMAAKSGRKTILGKSCQYALQIPCESKIASKIASILLCFRDKRVFAFYTEIQDGRQKWPGKSFLVKVISNTRHIPTGSKILSKSLYLTPFPR